ASETQMSGLRERAETMMDLLESRTQQLAAAMTGRFEALEARSHGFAIDLEKHEADARDALRQRAATLNEEVSATRARLDREEAESLVSLRARLSALRDEAGSLSRALRDGEATAMADWQAAVQRMGEDVARMDSDIAAHHHARLEQTARLGALTEASLARLIQAEARIESIALADQQLAGSMDTRLDTIERRLAETDRSVEKLTEGSARLLDLIQSSERQSRERLPRALDASEKRLAEYNAQVEKLHDFVASTHANGKGLAESLSTAHGTLLHASAEIETMHNALGEKLNAQNGAIAAMREHLAQVGTDTDEIATRARGELEASLARLAAAMQASVRGIEAQGAARIEALADRLGEEGGAAIAAAMDRQIQHISPRIEQAATHAAAISQQATEQLQAQISAVNDLAGHLEARVDAARTRAEEQVDNDFARRAAIITDALKSAAIDITRALGEEVTDTAWAAYLRGDRGVFSRKAIRLLETGEAREVQHLYEGDPRLRDAVNHYIHDFEAMLRQLLSTRDGHALGVTLLSSDLGKLYVALAQALDRLRS
ncbi:MAG TPA: ATPase, partial [Novosphingobium sp.]|nr:ATPase [Novosphingobium sp.]